MAFGTRTPPTGTYRSDQIDSQEYIDLGVNGIAKKVVLYDADGNALVPVSVPSAITSGRKTVTSAGTAEALVGSATPCKYVMVSALLGNTNQVVIGDSGVKATTGATQEGIILIPGNDPVRIDIDDVSLLYVDAQTNGEGVAFSYFL